jgi:hypothetical protein
LIQEIPTADGDGGASAGEGSAQCGDEFVARRCRSLTGVTAAYVDEAVATVGKQR